MSSEQQAHRVVIPATCRVCEGAEGFTNLVVTGEEGGTRVVFDPHAVGACVVSLDPDAARRLYQILGQWLGITTWSEEYHQAGRDRRGRRGAKPRRSDGRADAAEDTRNLGVAG